MFHVHAARARWGRGLGWPPGRYPPGARRGFRGAGAGKLARVTVPSQEGRVERSCPTPHQTSVAGWPARPRERRREPRPPASIETRAAAPAAVRTTITVPDCVSMVALLGSGDELLRLVEAEVAADVHVRGNEIADHRRSRPTTPSPCGSSTS